MIDAGSSLVKYNNRMNKVYFLRHGESHANKKQICAGHLDVALTEKGRQEAEDAGREIMDKGTKIDLIISSPLVRAFGTAKIVADVLGYPSDKIIKSDLLKERFRGDLEGGPSSAHRGMTDEELVRKGAESEAEMISRAIELISYVKSLDAENILIVSHNQFGKLLLANLINKRFGEMDVLHNAKIFELPV